MDSDLFLVLGWGSPIGIGIFLVLLAGMIFLLVKANAADKQTKSLEKEKGLEKKSVVREALRSFKK